MDSVPRSIPCESAAVEERLWGRETNPARLARIHRTVPRGRGGVEPAALNRGGRGADEDL